jgi:methylase of polypeptide subunit release factors
MPKVYYGSIEVGYTGDTAGGGRTAAQDLVLAVEREFGHVGRVCEFAAGTGFIGFALLGRGLCDSVCFLDIYGPAIEQVKETAKSNGLLDRTAAYVSDGLTSVPASESWDLVVANPPSLAWMPEGDRFGRKRVDVGWAIHRRFYSGVRRFLRPGGSILFLETSEGSSPAMWPAIVEEAGLEMVRVLRLSYAERVGNAARELLRHPDFPKMVVLAKVAGAPTFYRRYYIVWSRNPLT